MIYSFYNFFLPKLNTFTKGIAKSHFIAKLKNYLAKYIKLKLQINKETIRDYKPKFDD